MLDELYQSSPHTLCKLAYFPPEHSQLHLDNIIIIIIMISSIRIIIPIITAPGPQSVGLRAAPAPLGQGCGLFWMPLPAPLRQGCGSYGSASSRPLGQGCGSYRSAPHSFLGRPWRREIGRTGRSCPSWLGDGLGMACGWPGGGLRVAQG